MRNKIVVVTGTFGVLGHAAHWQVRLYLMRIATSGPLFVAFATGVSIVTGLGELDEWLAHEVWRMGCTCPMNRMAL